MTSDAAQDLVLQALGSPVSGKVFDLSVTVDNNSRWPGHGPVVHSVSLNHRQGGAVIRGEDRVGMMTDRVELPLHAGTHVDAPNHFSVDGRLAGGVLVDDSEISFAKGRGHFGGIDTVPPYVGPGTLLDLTRVLAEHELEPGAEITRSDLLRAMDRQSIDSLPRGAPSSFTPAGAAISPRTVVTTSLESASGRGWGGIVPSSVGDGQGDCNRRRHVGDHRCRADIRRVRVHPRRDRRAHDARRQDPADLRGNQPDHAADRRQEVLQEWS